MRWYALVCGGMRLLAHGYVKWRYVIVTWRHVIKVMHRSLKYYHNTLYGQQGKS